MLTKFNLAIFLMLLPALSLSAQFERIDQQSSNPDTRTSVSTRPPSTIEIPISAPKGSTFVLKNKTQPTLPSDSATSRSQSTKGQGQALSHTRYYQLINDTPVWSAEIIHHVGASKNHVTGNLLINIDLDKIVEPVHSDSDIFHHAMTLAQEKFNHVTALTIDKESLTSYLFRRPDGVLTYILKIDLFVQGKNFIARPKMIIDKSDLSLLESWDGLQHIDGHTEVNATGPGGNETVGRHDYGSGDWPNLVVRYKDSSCTMENNRVKVVDLNHAEAYKNNRTAFSYDCSEETNYINTHKEINGAYSPLNDAFHFGNTVLDMYHNWYGITPTNQQLVMQLHYKTGYANAFWDSSAGLLTFGDGNERSHPLVDINVISHEISHAFTATHSNLIYLGKSGGINESFSDMAGEAAEYYLRGSVDWIVAADSVRGNGGLRYFEDPTKDGHSISHALNYRSAHVLGVHSTSGVFNRAFYLLAKTQGWNVRTAFDVFTYANKNYWLWIENYVSAACGALSSSRDLNMNSLDVALAFLEVGIVCPSYSIDLDQDQINDVLEARDGFNFNSQEDALLDFDNDGISNADEFSQGLLAKYHDSDFDGLSDKEEILLGTKANNADTDSDGMSDKYEIDHGLSAINPSRNEDLDGDGLSNIYEFLSGSDPSAKDEVIANFSLETFDQPLSSFWKIPGTKSFRRIEVGNEFLLTHAKIRTGERSTIEFEVDVSQGSKLLVDVKLNLFVGSNFTITANGNEIYKNEVYGSNWQTISHQFSEAGSVTIGFEYEPLILSSQYINSVLIDNVRITAAPGYYQNWASYYSVGEKSADPDNDGLTNINEFIQSTSPLLTDSDGDGLNDYIETTQHLTNPLKPDTDGDGLSDYEELEVQMNPNNQKDAYLDSDGDGYTNLAEFLYSGDIQDADVLPISLINFEDDFSSPTLKSEWSPLKNPRQGQWAINDQRYQSLPIANFMWAKAELKHLFKEGTLSFDVIVDTEAESDYFMFFIDGKLIHKMSGIKNTQVSVEISQGMHTLHFVYKKDSEKSTTNDFVAIDNVVFMALDGGNSSNNDNSDNASDANADGTQDRTFYDSSRPRSSGGRSAGAMSHAGLIGLLLMLLYRRRHHHRTLKTLS